MRPPVNPNPPGMRQRITSVAVAFTVDAYETQPTGSTVPVGRLPAVTATLTDDASQAVARRMTVNLSAAPDWLRAGMWIRGTVGIQTLQPVIYRMPSLIITDVAEDLARLGGAVITAEDPAVVVNGRPYESDTVITGTLRSLVASRCALALTRPTDVTGVPDIPVPANTVAEFGTGGWDACLTMGDAMGYALRFTDAGDVVATDRNALAPSPVAIVERCASLGGTSHKVRAPTAARVLVTRGSDTIGLVGAASWVDIMGTAPPVWYLPYVVTDRQEGDTTTTQVQADALAKQLLRSRLADLSTYDDMPILPAPWLEAGTDVVAFYGRWYYVRAVSFDFPTLATSVTLRRVQTT